MLISCFPPHPPLTRSPFSSKEKAFHPDKLQFIAFLKLSAEIKDYVVDDIGEFYALPENNESWEQYRKENPEWNVLPYDLEFDGNATILDIVKKYVDCIQTISTTLMFMEIYVFQ